MSSDQNKWQRVQFRNNKVWMALDSKGQPQIKGGKVLIKYQLEQDYEYWVHQKGVKPLVDGKVSSPSSSKTASKMKHRSNASQTVETQESVDCDKCICLYTDGASSGNPGPSGIGVLMRYKKHEKEISKNIGPATNNIAELEAIRVGLNEVKNKTLPVRVFTDSSYALGLLAKGWKPKKNLELVTAIRSLMEQFTDLRFIKVKGHAGHPENERADRLATSAIASKSK